MRRPAPAVVGAFREKVLNLLIYKVPTRPSANFNSREYCPALNIGRLVPHKRQCEGMFFMRVMPDLYSRVSYRLCFTADSEG
jgi:hypothetical protein